MTIYYLLDAIAQRLEDIFKDYTIPEIENPKFKKIKVYRQIPPQPQYEEESIYPACIVELGDGEDSDSGSTQEVVVTLAIYDPDEQFQGYKTICSLIERIRHSFGENPTLENRYEILKPIKWTPVVNDEEHAIYFGQVVFKVEIPPIQLGYNPYI